MAGYSGTPLPKKLGIKPGSRVLVLGAPKSFRLGEPHATRIGREHDVILLFSDRRVQLEASFPRARGRLASDGGLWVAWPKKASGVATDLDENVVRRIGLGEGLVDNKVCAIDETWSGLRFVVRLRDR